MLPFAHPQPDTANREGEFQTIQREEFRTIVDTRISTLEDCREIPQICARPDRDEQVARG